MISSQPLAASRMARSRAVSCAVRQPGSELRPFAFRHALLTSGRRSLLRAEHLECIASYSLRTIDGIMNVLDVNDDGKIDRAEMRAAFQRYEYTALRLALGIA